jgi:uncharacterized protein YabE (DUF348 family)
LNHDSESWKVQDWTGTSGNSFQVTLKHGGEVKRQVVHAEEMAGMRERGIKVL